MGVFCATVIDHPSPYPLHPHHQTLLGAALIPGPRASLSQMGAGCAAEPERLGPTGQAGVEGSMRDTWEKRNIEQNDCLWGIAFYFVVLLHSSVLYNSLFTGTVCY